ncbi:hypothetical protein [Rossellomorea marisflavi]|uniref:Uncharacterized protein n=1 Tax=Rossellomorea marisflavi TaxID=189381 RepID=A0A0J5Y6H3_9BACI|nr:hypothetical protein [Rossellomorea marisflavi]KMK96377.1 hypothetical protein VL03_01875 [Rossellomorea marisflavi]KML06584.1 hypothetical protein VL06_10905 [Rossellomorea marisflavi]KML32968.1 hypothetical protein VL12_14360 [Rossellomorea marisflavi]KZE49959.1 hypothetical protein AV649_02710 [Rossellomorea marisflavi]MCM2604458.1 hypothetical protein [Rossellomorea marisflavi]
MKEKLSRHYIELLAIQSACRFCKSLDLAPTLENLAMISGFSEEKILIIMETSYQLQEYPKLLKKNLTSH